MTQQERERLVVLRKAGDKQMTQNVAGKELGVSERQVRRLLQKLKTDGGQSGGAGVERPGFRPETERESDNGDRSDSFIVGLRGIRANAVMGVIAGQARYRCGSGDGAEANGGGQAVAGEWALSRWRGNDRGGQCVSEKRLSAVGGKACNVLAANAEDAHRSLGPEHDIESILSHFESRKVLKDHTVR